jgi:hypothetical protein
MKPTIDSFGRVHMNDYGKQEAKELKRLIADMAAIVGGRRFAYLPVKMSDGIGEWVWLQWYWRHRNWRRYESSSPIWDMYSRSPSRRIKGLSLSKSPWPKWINLRSASNSLDVEDAALAIIRLSEDLEELQKGWNYDFRRQRK